MVDLPLLWRDASVRVRDVPFSLEREGLTGRLIRLSFEGVQVATSIREGAFRTRYRVEVRPGVARGGPTALVVVPAAGSRRHTVEADGAPVGEIRPLHLFSRGAEVDLPPTIPLAVQGLLLAVVIDAWRRSSN